ncbi:hypothetical protein CDV31_008156 [Fusarium ambrosium]|uniref:Uncharacterized protein n=1 Tax=Fusarium ambrosium TaxID=131363 RepID=A0A428U232_9HYPO|nr:hypothetical protein CDV31_008156 [Fusarium ambrosium]
MRACVSQLVWEKSRVQLANYWLEWITNYYAMVVGKFKENIAKAMAQIDEVMADDSMPDRYAVQWLELMAQFEEMADNADLMRIDTSGFPAFNSPITEAEDIEEDGNTQMGGT